MLFILQLSVAGPVWLGPCSTLIFILWTFLVFIESLMIPFLYNSSLVVYCGNCIFLRFSLMLLGEITDACCNQ